MRKLVTVLTPVIRSSVAYALVRSTSPLRRAARQEVEDITQTVLLALFADRGRSLLQWDAARGLDLPSYVALRAKRETLSLLRSARRSPYTEQPTQIEDLDLNAAARMGPESETISRNMLASLAEELRSRLTPKGFEIFELMFVRALPVTEVCALAGITPDAFYAWRSRLARLVREITAELGKAPPTVRPEDGSSSGRVAIPPAPPVPRASRPRADQARAERTVERVERAAERPPKPAVEQESQATERTSEPDRASDLGRVFDPPPRESGESARPPPFETGPMPVVKRGRAAS